METHTTDGNGVKIEHNIEFITTEDSNPVEVTDEIVRDEEFDPQIQTSNCFSQRKQNILGRFGINP